MQSSTFSLRIMYDTSPSNPFTEWDTEPPVMQLYNGYIVEYGTEGLAHKLLNSLSDLVDTFTAE